MQTTKTFKSLSFSSTQLGAALGVSRQSIVNWEREGLIESYKKPRGSTFSRVFDWSAHCILADRVVRPSITSKIQTFCNLKGGVGKTTVSTQVAMQAVLMGYKVLFIDADPQGHASLTLGCEGAHELPTLGEVLEGDCEAHEAIVSITPLFDLMPANLGLSAIESFLARSLNREKRLSKSLDVLKEKYDLIFIDTNPSNSILNTNFLLWSDSINVVTQTLDLAIAGLTTFFELLTEIYDQFPQLNQNVRIIPNLFRSQEKRCAISLGVLSKEYPDLLTSTFVRQSTAFQAAQTAHTTVMQRNDSAAEDIKALTRELLFDEITKEKETNIL